MLLLFLLILLGIGLRIISHVICRLVVWKFSLRHLFVLLTIIRLVRLSTCRISVILYLLDIVTKLPWKTILFINLFISKSMGNFLLKLNEFLLHFRIDVPILIFNVLSKRVCDYVPLISDPVLVHGIIRLRNVNLILISISLPL